MIFPNTSAKLEKVATLDTRELEITGKKWLCSGQIEIFPKRGRDVNFRFYFVVANLVMLAFQRISIGAAARLTNEAREPRCAFRLPGISGVDAFAFGRKMSEHK